MMSETTARVWGWDDWDEMYVMNDVEQTRDDILTALNALEAQVQQLQAERDKEIEYTEVLTNIIDGYDWLADGRGEYTYDDARYDDDVMRFVQQLRDVMHGYQSQPYQSFVTRIQTENA